MMNGVDHNKQDIKHDVIKNMALSNSILFYKHVILVCLIYTIHRLGVSISLGLVKEEHKFPSSECPILKELG